MISDPIDIELNRMCGEIFLPSDLLPPPEYDNGNCARGILNAFAMMGAIFTVLFATGWLIGWLQR